MCDVLGKSRVGTVIASLSDPLYNIVDKSIIPLFNQDHLASTTVSEYLGEIEPSTLYKYTDFLGLSYIYLLLPESAVASVMYIGPFLSSPLTSRQIFEISEKNLISPKNQRLLEEYYGSVPIIKDTSPLLVMIDTFCEHIWGANYFSVIDIETEKMMEEYRNFLNYNGDEQ